MSKTIEFEKVYLAKSLPTGIKEARSSLIRDIRIPQNSSNSHLRLRQKDDTYVITKKYPIIDGDTSSQYEFTIELDKDEFNALASCSDSYFVKRRFYMELAGRPAEVDVYQEKLEGLVVIDFEFDSEDQKNAFVTPDFVLADVTAEEAIVGGFLSGKSFDEIFPLIKKYGYKKLEVNL
ncbi:MAG: hypothetical protein WCQ49_00150 [Candidatus Saccharibacteria bacterium]